MPSISRHLSPTPREVRFSKSASPPRAVRFDTGALVTAVIRPMVDSEAWAIYRFEEHAQRCSFCYRPYEVYRNGGQLCEHGHALAQEVASHLYKKRDGLVYSNAKEDQRLTNVEVPRGFEHGLSLLKAIERSLRHRRREPFVSFDRSYFVPPRVSPKISYRTQRHASSPLRHDTYESFPEYEEHQSHHHRRRKHYHSSPRADFVDWPDHEDPSFSSKNQYRIEIIEPAYHQYAVKEPRRREYRRSRFW
ncbi:hypothetical protein EV356DRAFT_499873 [Viridothelium virens]|uniref:Uncharacterized protein n=1 Tax=Viridothelium virens TaxID=1048519 RepID=A0A6A6HNH1_VIRVR|nr:hypothetical protein EV356DRAFT_499873 [Viridothelium virens]